MTADTGTDQKMEMMEDRKGRTVHKRTKDMQSTYKVKEMVHRGNFSVIRRCYRKSDRKNFALKIFRKKRRANNVIVDQMQKQIPILQGMNHRNICKLYDTFITPNYIHMIMEYCDGRELFEHIHSNNDFSEKDAAWTIKQICQGLQHMHQCGIVHRDIKPENIIYSGHDTPNPCLKIVSFEFSRSYEGGCSTLCGTPEYVAPEIIRKIPYEEKVDMWALGILLYIMLAGYFPFYGEDGDRTCKSLFRSIRGGEFKFQKEEWDKISPEAKALVKKMLQISPSKRATATEVLQHPWMSTEDETPLQASKIRGFQKREKFRRGIAKMLSVIRFKKALLDAVEQLDMRENAAVTFDLENTVE